MMAFPAGPVPYQLPSITPIGPHLSPQLESNQSQHEYHLKRDNISSNRDDLIKKSIFFLQRMYLYGIPYSKHSWF
jgi:hypothetical protein